MFKLDQKTTIDDSNFFEALLQLHDEFDAFNEYLAFFCDAVVGVLANDERLDSSTILGINRCACWLKYRMEEFIERFEMILNNPCAENSECCPDDAPTKSRG